MIKIKISFITWLLISFTAYTYSQSGWVNCTPIQSTYFASMSFLNDNTGYLLDIFCGVYKTTNGGLNWVQTSAQIYYDVWDIEFVNELTGYICGDYYCSIMKTTNGGYNWQIIKLVNHYLNDVKFVNPNTGYVVGWSGWILKTTNAGENWVKLDPGVNADFRSISIVETTNIYIAGQNTVYSSNSGNDWRVIATGSVFGNFVFFTTISTGILANMRYTNVLGKIFRTTNLGSTWSLVKQDTVSYSDVFFTNYNEGYICGSNSIILKTTDVGSNWYNQFSVGNYNLIRIKFTSQYTGYCVGDGIVLKTTNGGEPIGIRPIDSKVPQTFSLSQNYPNPFNPVTKIKFSIPAVETTRRVVSTKIIVYDALGREIAILVNEQLSPGTFEVEWDASNFPSGVYFYKLTAGDYIETKKMILIK